MGCETISREEIKRITSPDSMVDVVLIRVNAGATTPYAYKLYIVPVGGTPKKGRELFEADKIIGMKIQWKQSKFLEIQYEKGRIFHFTNFWSSKEIENFRYVVELRLVPLT